MKTIEQLKKQYNPKPIKEIENEAKKSQAQAKQLQEKMIEILFYLERTQRFKENPVYQKSTFREYLSFEFGMRFSTYHETRLALINFPELSKKYSPQLYRAIKTKCGADEVPRVVEEIKEEEKKKAKVKKAGKLPREAIQEIIDRHKKPAPPPVVKPSVRDLEIKLITVQESEKKLLKILDQKDRQIEKLKARVKALTKERDQLLGLLGPIVAHVKESSGVVEEFSRH